MREDDSDTKNGRENDRPETQLYRIGDFAHMVGLPVSTIRFYEKRGLYPDVHYRNKYRMYTHYDAFRTNSFLVLLQYGFTVEQAINRLDEKQSDEEFVGMLQEQKLRLSREMELASYRIHRIDNTLSFLERRSMNIFTIVMAQDYIYAHASHGLDFSASQRNARILARFYDNLSVASCSRIIKKDEIFSDVECVDPSYIIGMPADAIHLLGDVRPDEVCRLRLGKCLKYTRLKTREESVLNSSFDDLRREVRVRGLTPRGDLLLLPTFLNMDGNGTDAETLMLPVD